MNDLNCEGKKEKLDHPWWNEPKEQDSEKFGKKKFEEREERESHGSFYSTDTMLTTELEKERE